MPYLVLGKSHIETLRFPIHPLIFQFTAAHKIHLMQLTSNSIKCLVASIILIEVEDKKITLDNLLFALQINKTPIPPSNPSRSSYTFYLTANNPSSKKILCFLANKQWIRTRKLLAIFWSLVMVGSHPISIKKFSQSPPNFPLVSIYTPTIFSFISCLCLSNLFLFSHFNLML